MGPHFKQRETQVYFTCTGDGGTGSMFTGTFIYFNFCTLLHFMCLLLCISVWGKTKETSPSVPMAWSRWWLWWRSTVPLFLNGIFVTNDSFTRTEVEAAPLSAPASPAAETPKEEPVSEEVSVQHIESTAVSTESAEEPTPTTPKSESQQVTPKSESFQHSTPKSCPTPEVRITLNFLLLV